MLVVLYVDINCYKRDEYSMSIGIVVLQSNENDAGRIQTIQDVLRPSRTIYHKEGAPMIDIPPPVGRMDYLLFTGGHGAFKNDAPTKVSGLFENVIRKWINGIGNTITFKTIILDTCFSSSFIIHFAGLLQVGGVIVCAHGSGEGFVDALINPMNRNKSVGEALGGIVDGVSDFDWHYTSLSLAMRYGNDSPLMLYTTNEGENRRRGLRIRNDNGVGTDSSLELGKLDSFLRTQGVMINGVSLDALKAMLASRISIGI